MWDEPNVTLRRRNTRSSDSTKGKSHPLFLALPVLTNEKVSMHLDSQTVAMEV